MMSSKKPNYWASSGYILLLAGVIAVAIFFRTRHLLDFPPGLHYDEAIDLMQANRLRQGQWFFYTYEGWGREALFYYLVALARSLVPYGPMALRLTTASLSVLLIVLSAFLAQRYHSKAMALISSGWFAVTFWPVSTGRVGVRNMTFPFMLALVVVVFASAVVPALREPAPHNHRRQAVRFTLAGALLGVSQYTYQPARFILLIFAGFAIYLWLVHPLVWNRLWPHFVRMAATGLVIALPLILVLAQGGDTGEADRAFVMGPVSELMAGDPRFVVQNIIATAGMFSIRGDPLIAYNVPGRPVFYPVWTGLPFYLGVAMALRRWRQPKYAFVLIWLVVMAIPTILTEPAPHFNRTLGMQLPVFWLAALPLAEVLPVWIRDGRRVLAPLLGACVVVLLATTAVETWRSYFHDWVQDPRVDSQYNANVSRILWYVAHNASSRPTVISSRNYEDADPVILAAGLGGWREEIRWIDAGQAVAFPDGEDIRLVLAGERGLNPDLSAYLQVPAQAEVVRQGFVVVSVANTLRGATEAIYVAEMGSDAGSDVIVPITFRSPSGDQAAHLLRAEFPSMLASPTSVNILTEWSIPADGKPAPLSLFAHLVDSSGAIVGQHDGLGYPPHNWRAGDVFVQVQTIRPPASLPPGSYRLQIGMYDRSTNLRWHIMDGDQSVGERLILGTLSVP